MQRGEKQLCYFLNSLDAACTIYLRFLIGNLCLQHGDFTNTAGMWPKDTVLDVTLNKVLRHSNI
jgi:hypothetical protein